MPRVCTGADGYITKPYGRNTLEYAQRFVMKQGVPEPCESRPAVPNSIWQTAKAR